jgi:hypothetical protein
MNRRRAEFLVLTVLSFAVAVHAQATRLDRFVGKDLREDPSAQRKVDNVLGIPSGGDIGGETPWRVWKTDQNGRTRYVVLMVQPEFIVPGSSRAFVVLLGASTKRIASWSFATGWRITPASASFEFSKEAGSELMIINMAQFVNGRDVAREYFAINDDRLRLVRIENHNGEAVQNEYSSPNSEIGVVPNATTVDEWAKMLESKDRAVVLSVLTFLGGQHSIEPPLFQESTYGTVVQKLIGNPRIRELVEGLSNSDNRWVRQAADLVARGSRQVGR